MDVKLDVCGCVDVVLTWRTSAGGGGHVAGDVGWMVMLIA